MLNISMDALAEELARELGIGMPAIQSGDKGAAHISRQYTSFKRTMYPPYEHAPHQEMLDQHLMQVERYVATEGREGIGRLIISMPPRHGKTINVSRLFPAWFMGLHPDTRLILASYGAMLAYRNSRAVRNLIKADRYQEFFPGIELAHDTASVQEWDIEGHQGGAIAAGVGGGITGHGAKLLIIDDPIKSRSDAESPTYRESLIEWYGDAYTRLEEPGAAIILMHTRWHKEDLAGYLLDSSADQWTELKLPALAGDNDPLGRQPGEALWNRYPVEKLEKTKETLGEYRFSAEYQQSPRSREGGLFDTALIKIVDLPPACKQIVRFYDLALTEKSNADYTAGVKMGVTDEEEFVLLHVSRIQKSAPDVQKLIAHNAVADGPDVPIRLEAEKTGIIQLQYLLRDEQMRPFMIDAEPPKGDKYTRAGPFAMRVKAGRVLMVKGEWNRAYLDELALFPNVSHDDQVDATSGAYDMLANGVLDFNIIEVDT